MIDVSYDARDYVRTYRAIDPALCPGIVEQINSGTWKPHAYQTPSESLKTYDNDLSVTRAHVHDVDVAIKTHIKLYASEYKWLNLEGRSATRYQRYVKGTLMRPHVDHIKTLFNNTGGIPVLTILGQLNTGYLGGELKIQGDVYTLDPGDIVIFPSNFMYPHAVDEVTGGERYSFVSWAW